MLFNFEKCKCLHAGHGNTEENNEMGGTLTDCGSNPIYSVLVYSVDIWRITVSI